mgnify:CR=1 FL=1
MKSLSTLIDKAGGVFLLPVAIAIVAFVLIGAPSSWLTLTVAGLSMGGSLALRLAQEHPQAISGLVLVNPSVHTERLDRHLLPVVKHLVGSFPGISNDIAKPGVDEIPYNRTPLKAAASLMEMWSVIKRDIAFVHQPLLLFRSAQDHVVEPSNAEWILSHIHSSDVEEVVLDNSYHVATLDYDAQIIVDTSVAFIERLSKTP